MSMNHRAPGMRLQLTLRAERDHDVEIAVPAGTKLGAVAALLWAEARVPPGTRITLDGRPVEHHAELGRGGLRSGALLRLGTAAPRIAAARSVWQLHVIGGPDAGRRIGLSRGELTIGRGSEADVRIEDPDMSRSHARLSMRHDGIWLRDLSSSNGTLVDETPVRATELKLSPEDIITAGSSQLRLAPASDPPAATMDAEAGTRLVSRAARRPAPAPAEPVELPIAPADPTHPSVPWVTALLPAVLSIGLALALGNRQLLAFALVGPLALLAGAVTDRLGWRRSRRKARLEHRSAAAAATERVRDRLAIEAAQRRREAPDPAAVAEIVGTPSCRLWERRPEDRDFLSLRVGTAVQPAQTGVLRGSEPLPPALLPRTPVQVDLASGPLAITGPPAATRASARWLVTQALALHAPRDLRVCALVEEGAADWRWLRWSPPERVTVAAAPAARRALGKALEQHKARRAAGAASRTRSDPGDASSAEPWLLVLIDLAESDADQVWLGSLLSDAAGLGITGIVVAHRPAQLPPACAQRARFTHHASGTLSLAAPGSPEVNEIRADAVRPDWAERLSRQLAPLREADCEGGVDLPAAADLGALLEQGGTLATAESGAWAAAALAASWQSRASCSTPIGVGRDGPVWLDLVRDGPHALIAGMTGSGKSELLRALIAGLTARQPPERLALVLIDYKGGSAFADCQGLPHVTGMATDLDPQLTDRVLVSLNAELRRREATLAAAGAHDLSEYWALPEQRLDPLPRLAVVVDEFAAMAGELPELLTGLINIATRGRSLGLHLILATQRPAGVISPQITANLALRICLRVKDEADSIDVIGTSAAARIPTSRPGRAIAVLADGAVEFQTASVSRRTRRDSSPEFSVTRLDHWNRHVAVTPDRGESEPPTDLARLVAAAQRAAELTQQARPRRCWLPPLPTLLAGSDLPVSSTASGDYARPGPSQAAAVAVSSENLTLGLLDDPEHQAQPPLMHSLASGGALGYVGGARSGRSTGLRTFIGTAVRGLGPDRLHVQVIDCAGGSLAALAELPHCGSMLTREDPDAVQRLIARLVAEWRRRQRLLAELGVDTVSEAHARGQQLAWIVLAVDGWEHLAELSERLDHGKSADAVLELARDGAAAGFTVVMSGGRGLLAARCQSALRRILLLEFPDRADYALAGVPLVALPRDFTPGRCLAVPEQLTAQLAVLGTDPSADGQRAAIASLAAHTAQPDPARAPIRVRPLPVSVDRATISRVTDGPETDGQKVLIGVGGDEASAVWVDLFGADRRFLIAGPPRSGRSTAALALADGGYASGADCLVCAGADSPLRGWALARGLPLLEPSEGPPSSWSWPEAQGRRRLFLIDDSEECDSAWEDFAVGAQPPGAAIVAVARTSEALVSLRGVASALSRSQTGLLLQPQGFDGELFGLPTVSPAAARVPGRGLLVNAAPPGLPLQVIRAEPAVSPPTQAR